jgi:N6-adenosine-specific RNA methylase IME4
MTPSLFAVTVPPPPQAGHYQTIYADPPWQERGAGQIKRGADGHYPLMSTRAIAELPVDEWAATNAHLYLWVTNNFLPDGLRVLEAWGFRYVTKIDWFKGDRFDDDSDVSLMSDAALQMGIGQYFRGVTESCLFGVRGVLPYRTRTDGKRAQGRTGFHAPRREHSVKPDKMRAMVELVSHGPYLELFARRPADGWDVWGNQVVEVEASV